MRKNLLYLLIVFSFLNIATAQDYSGKIKYNIKLLESYYEKNLNDHSEENSILRDFSLNSYNKLNKVTPFISTTIEFNNKVAIVKTSKAMNVDSGLDINAAINSFYLDGVYSFDFDKRTSIFQTRDHTGIVRIVRDLNAIEWEFTGETKMIQGFLCREAKAQYSYNYFFYNDLTAWFTTELAFPFGPIGIGGLPGAILELSTNRFTYYATDIKIDNKHKELKISERGEKHHFDSYREKLIKDNPLNEMFRDKEVIRTDK